MNFDDIDLSPSQPDDKLAALKAMREDRLYSSLTQTELESILTPDLIYKYSRKFYRKACKYQENFDDDWEDG